MGELRGELDLTQEPLAPDPPGQLRRQHLDGHLAPRLLLLGQEYRRHAPPADLPVDDIAIAERILYLVKQFRHLYRSPVSPGWKQRPKAPERQAPGRGLPFPAPPLHPPGPYHPSPNPAVPPR